MNNRRLGRLLREHFRNHEVEGQPGYWRVLLPELAEEDPKLPEDNNAEEKNGAEQNGHAQNGAPQELGPGADKRLDPVLIVMTDDRADRMRIMVPIRPFDTEDVDDLRLALIALHANYDRALDARYAVQDGILWSVFIHPLGSLTKKDLLNGISQVQMLRSNTGTTYNSSELFFGPQMQEPEQPAPADDDDSKDQELI